MFDTTVFLVLSAMWGLSFLFIKVALQGLSPLWIVAVRTLVGAAVLVAMLLLTRGRLPDLRANWRHLTVVAALNNSIPWALLAWAEQSIPSGLAAVINALTPLSTLTIAASVGVERLTGRRVTGLVVALGGVTLAVAADLSSPDRLLAAAAVVGSTVLYGSASVYAKRHLSGRERPLSIAAGQVLFAALLSLPAAALVGPTPAWAALAPQVVASVVALGVLGTGLAFLAFYALMERVGPTNAIMTTYLVPVVGLAAGAVLLDERLGPLVLAGTAAIVAGVYLAQRERAVPVEAAGQA